MREVKREEAHLKINKVDVFCVCVGRERGYVSFGGNPSSLPVHVHPSLLVSQTSGSNRGGGLARRCSR